MVRFLFEIRRRNVLKVAAAYIVSGWVLLQVTDVIAPALDLPPWSVTFVLYLLIIGFPLALLLSWFFELSPSGLQQDPEDRASGRPGLTRNMALTVATLFVALGYLAYLLVISDERFTAEQFVTVAVLPFGNGNGNPEEEYFVAGFHEGLISNLSRLSALRVISKTSVNGYRDSNRSIAEIADELNVDAVIEGTVSRSGDLVQVDVQLIDGESQSALWTDNFSGPLERTLALQGEIVRDAARFLDADISNREEAELLNAEPINPDSYELYLKGMFEINRGTPAGLMAGMEILNQAVTRYPGDAFAWLALANGYILLGHSTEGVRNSFTMARSAGEKARTLNPNLADSYDVMAGVLMYRDWDWQAAEENFIQALNINPSLAWSYYHYAWLLALQSRMDEAIEAHTRARDLDPFFSIYSAWLGGLYLINDDLEQALDNAQRAQAINPQDPNTLWVLGDTYFELGRIDEALEIYQELANINPEMSWQLGRAYAMLGREEEARRIAENLEQGGLTPQKAIGLVSLWPYLGNMDRAIELLYYEDMHTWLPWTRIMSQFEPLRADPRYQDFLRERLKLPPLDT